MGDQNSAKELEVHIPQRYPRRQQGSRTLNISSTSPPLPRHRSSKPLPLTMDQDSTTPDGSPARPATSRSFEGHANSLIGGTTPLKTQLQFREVDQGSLSMTYPSGIGMYLDAPHASQVNISNIVHQSSESRIGDGVLSHTLPGSPHRVPISSSRYSSRKTEDLSAGDRQTSAWNVSASFNQRFGFQSSRSSSSGSTQAADDRTFLPSQLDKSPSGVFTHDSKHIPSRHGPGAKMVRISPTQRSSSAADTSETSHAHFTSIAPRVEMPTPPISHRGTSLDAPSVDTKAAESSSTLNFEASRVLGHRRNQATISDLSAVAQRPASERLAPPKFEFGSSAVDPVADLKEDSPFDHKFAYPSLKYKYAQQAKARSNHPTVSGWEGAETQLDSQGVAHLTTMTSLMRLDPVDENSAASASPNEEDLISFNKTSDLQLAYRQGFGFNLEQLTSEEVREIHPSDQAVTGGAVRGMVVHDFGYPANHPINTATAAKHIRFASKSDHAPSAHHKSDSDDSSDSKASTLSLIDLGGCEVDKDELACDQDAGDEQTNALHDDAVQSATEYQPPTSSALIDQFSNPPTPDESATHTTIRFVEDQINETDHFDDTSIYIALATRPPVDLRPTTPNRTKSPDFEDYDYVPPIEVNKLRKRHPSDPHQQHQRSSLAGFLRRISGHISSFIGARQGLEHVNADAARNQVFMGGNGVLDRESQFPARAAEPEEPRVVSEPLFTAPAQPHKRSSSFGRWLGKLGGKGGMGRKGGKQVEKDENSVGWRLSVHFSEVFGFRNVFDEGLWHGLAGV